MILYYAVPCLQGYLEEDYMENLMCLSEGVYILLRDSISELALNRASLLLEKFYSTFQSLYGDGSCGLNVHNTGLHLVQYVKLWGPLWAWSCFPFEDTNAMLLQAVHGTGLFLKQVMRYRQVQAYIRRKGINTKKVLAWKITVEAQNCSIAGALKRFSQNDHDLTEAVKNKLAGEDLQTADRVVVRGKKFFSSLYKRMQKRCCSVVLCTDGRICSVKTYVVRDGVVSAVVTEMERVEKVSRTNLCPGSHLVEVRSSDTMDVIDVLDLVDTLVYLKHDLTEYVVRMPNRHGHAIFK